MALRQTTDDRPVRKTASAAAGQNTSAASIERLLLNSIISSKDFTSATKHNITSEMFKGYRDEYEFVERYFNRHKKTPTRAAIKARFPQFSFETVDDTEHFAEELVSKHTSRELMKTMKAASETLVSGDVPAALKMLNTRMMEVAASIGVWDDDDAIANPQKVLDEAEDTVIRVATYGSAGISLGFDTYDARTGGMKPGELIVAGARQGEGKSWVLIKAVVEALEAGKTVVFNSLEMTHTQMMYRIYNFFSHMVGIPLRNTDLMSGVNFDLANLRAFTKKFEERMESTGAALHLTSSGGVSPLTIAAQIERRSPDLVVVDYIQLMKTEGEKNWATIGANVEGLKNLALDANIPIIAASQLNRADGLTKKGGTPPGVEALAQSDIIGNTADTVITMARGSDHTNYIRVPKNRHGISDFMFFTHFDPTNGVYREVTKTQYDTLLDLDANDANMVNKPVITNTPATNGGRAITATADGVRALFKDAGKADAPSRRRPGVDGARRGRKPSLKMVDPLVILDENGNIDTTATLRTHDGS